MYVERDGKYYYINLKDPSDIIKIVPDSSSIASLYKFQGNNKQEGL